MKEVLNPNVLPIHEEKGGSERDGLADCQASGLNRSAEGRAKRND